MLLALVALLMAVLPSLAGASGDASDPARRLRDMRCAAEAELAMAVMRARQAGLPLKKVLGPRPSDETRALVIRAYEAPREMTPEDRERAAEEFGNEAALECYEREADGAEK